MGSEGMQITIPDFDEDDFQSTPVPFGRSGPFGFGGPSGLESPPILTPTTATADRSFFSAHTRGDSLASDDSFLDHAPKRPFAHASQSSIATTSTAVTSTSTIAGSSTAGSSFSKKPSFASIRNAFKSGSKNSSDIPPLPSLDHHQAYPILKNPFNRSTSSLAHSATATSKQSNAPSPPHQHPHPPTPGESRPARSASRARGHSSARSHHSHSGSVFFGSENGSDHGHGFPFGHNPNSHGFNFGHPPNSPPPVPRVPEALIAPRSESPTISEEDEGTNQDSSKSPADYALHAIFIRFATLAEAKIDGFVRAIPDSDPILTDFFGPTLDPQFDDLLLSLGKIAQKRAKNVIDAIMRWRRGIRDSPATSSSNRRTSERASLAAIYVMCRALVAVLSTLPANALSDTMGYGLEETIFEQFRRPLMSTDTNYRLCAELYAGVLGCLAGLRFLSVTDRFLNELAPVSHGQIAKDSSTKFENLVKGLRYVQIKVWPPEAFEEGAEFMESLAKSFEQAHGLRFKVAFAETLTRLLHPIGKAAQAEVNHPQWEKAIEKIYPRAKEMMSKPRYWHVAYPLAVTALCVAPHQFFLKNWISCFEYGISKLKDKPYRIPVLNGILRLIWTYLYRCQEPASTSTAKLDGLLKHFFPAGRASVFPPEEHLEPFICIVHFILSRYFEYGRDFCLDLLQESTSASGTLAPERVGILVQATLLTLHGLERDEPTPTWPSSADFSTIPSWDDYPSSSDAPPASLLAKPGIQDFVDRFGAATSNIAQACFKAVGHMSVFDEQWSLARSPVGSASSFEESHNMVIRRHPEGAFAYPNHLASHISILQTCYQSWPRCLHTSSITVPDAVDMLLRGVIHVEPRVGEVAAAALRRFMKDASYAPAVLKCFTALLFDPKNLEREGTGHRILLESARLLNLWTSVVDAWVTGLTQKSKQDLAGMDLKPVLQQLEEIAVGVLFLLSHEVTTIRCAGVKFVRSLVPLIDHLSPEGISATDSAPLKTLFLSLLENDTNECSYLQGFGELLDRAELDRLQQWRRSAKPDVLLRIADSNVEKDRKVWRFVYPAFMGSSMSSCGKLIPNCRAIIEAATSRYHPTMLRLAGISSSSRTQASRPTEREGFRLVKENMSLIDQWLIWTKVLCSTAAVSDSRPAMTQAGQHTRAPSESTFERERMSTTRNLFKHLTPFMDADYTPFRDAAVLSISAFPLEGYPQLLEDLNLFASRQFYDDVRTKTNSPPSSVRSRRQARLHSAVARIYYLTAPYLQHIKSSVKQDALSHALKFVKDTQAFLLSPETRDNYSLQRLRRYFCGLVERLFDGLAGLPEADIVTPPHLHLTLYRMCEEWCQYGPQGESAKTRFILMQRAAAAALKDPAAESDAGERFQHETKLLSSASVGALASLCQKAYQLPDTAEPSSPTERSSQDAHKPLEAAQILERMHAVFEDGQTQLVASAKKALRSLLVLPQPGPDLLVDVLRKGFCDSTASLSSAAFFEVFTDAVCNPPGHSFTFAQVICLGLANLCHGNIAIRRHAFNTLVAMHEQSAGVIAMAEFEAMVANNTPSVYLQAHRLIVECLAGEHPEQAFDVLSEVSALLLRIHRQGNERVSHLMLQSLEHWMPNLEISAPDLTRLAVTPEGSMVVYHLLALTKRYSEAQPEQIAAIWARLVEVPDPLAGRAVVSFLVNESLKVATNAFVKCASEVVACLSRSAAGVQIFQELCSVCGPERMLPTFEHRLEQPSPEELELWSDLDVLFADDQPRHMLGSAQYAMVYIGSVALERTWTHHEQIPVILSAVLSHLDHRVLMLQSTARRMLFQLMRACVPRYSPAEKAGQLARGSLLSTIASMEEQGDSLFWLESDPEDVVMPRMKYIVDQVVSIIGQFVLDLGKNLAALSILYVEHCHIRSIAKRSLQVYRLLNVPLSQDVLGHFLGRLCTTISDDETELHHFAEAIVATLTTSVASEDLNPALLPRLFWATTSCLMTIVETEFAAAVKLFITLLDRLDLDNPEFVESVLAHRPESWNGMYSLHACLLSGLRSATTMADTFVALQWLSKISDSRLVEPSERRVCDLFALSLPWCLHSMATDQRDPALDDFCTSIGNLASKEGRDTISRIMTSFVKNRFRTKDDFLRQSIAGLREYYSATHWSDIATLLLGLALNKENWLRIHTMQVLKVFFQQRDPRNPDQSLATEHLMPLLRLVEGDLAAQALDVLEEPTKVSAGQNSRNVLRMSMHTSMKPTPVDEGEIFGVPEESGWCISQVKSRRSICRNNMMAVAQTCIGVLRHSHIDLEARSQILSFTDGLDEDLGVLVQDLHELSEFFQNTKPKPRVLIPSQQLEERVASIIARSTDNSSDVPQTPFTDVFHLGKPREYSEDSEDDSGSESELDAFIYDSPVSYQSAPNGRKLN